MKSVFEEEGGEIKEYVLTDADWEKIKELSKDKYQTWEWNYGKSPKFNIQNSQRFPAGTIDIRLDVEKGIIENAKIYGDFFGWGNVADIEAKLKGVRYEKAALDDCRNMDTQHYLGKIEKEELLDLIY